MKILETVDEAIDAIGGTNAAARLGKVVPSCVSNWRTHRVIPPEYFLIYTGEFHKRGLSFNPEIFGFKH